VPGYLSHLAARAFGAKPALRPRIPSIFESVPGAALPVAPDRGSLRVVAEEHIVSQPPEPLPAMTRVQAEPPLTPRADSLTAAPEPRPYRSAPRRGDPFQEVDAADYPAAPARPRLEPRTGPPAASDIPAPLTERVLARPELRSIEASQESQPATLQPAQRTPYSEPEHSRSSRAELAEPLPVRADWKEPRIERIEREPERAPAAAPHSPQAVPFAPQPELRPIERFPALAEPGVRQPPSVQVTIGRLIVEAVSPTPAAALQPVPRPQAPRLSLDDYLRQRRSQA
jgi:hypothetical protein